MKQLITLLIIFLSLGVMAQEEIKPEPVLTYAVISARVTYSDQHTTTFTSERAYGKNFKAKAYPLKEGEVVDLVISFVDSNEPIIEATILKDFANSGQTKRNLNAFILELDNSVSTKF